MGNLLMFHLELKPMCELPCTLGDHLLAFLVLENYKYQKLCQGMFNDSLLVTMRSMFCFLTKLCSLFSTYTGSPSAGSWPGPQSTRSGRDKKLRCLQKTWF